MNPEKRIILPGLAFKGFSSRYQQPALSEGFQDITEVEFKVGLSRADSNFRTDLARCSLMGVKWNEKFGLDIGPENSHKWLIMHSCPCESLAFTWLRRALPKLAHVCYITLGFACTHSGLIATRHKPLRGVDAGFYY